MLQTTLGTADCLVIRQLCIQELSRVEPQASTVVVGHPSCSAISSAMISAPSRPEVQLVQQLNPAYARSAYSEPATLGAYVSYGENQAFRSSYVPVPGLSAVLGAEQDRLPGLHRQPVTAHPSVPPAVAVGNHLSRVIPKYSTGPVYHASPQYTTNPVYATNPAYTTESRYAFAPVSTHANVISTVKPDAAPDRIGTQLHPWPHGQRQSRASHSVKLAARGCRIPAFAVDSRRSAQPAGPRRRATVNNGVRSTDPHSTGSVCQRNRFQSLFKATM